MYKMFKEYNELSTDDIYELSECIDDLYTYNTYDENQYIFIKNKIRHIMEIVIKEETDNEKIQTMVS